MVNAKIYGAVWLGWLVVGTLFYALHLNVSFSKGLYMAVNIGYSIGWGDIPETTIGSRVFSTFYVTIGASFVGLALTFFADAVVADHDNWYANQKQEEEFQNTMAIPNTPRNILRKIYAFTVYEWKQVRAIIVWLFWIAFMVGYAMIGIPEWKFNEALYFAVATCSTGGHYSIPENHWGDDLLFLLTGIFGAIGVPLMGVAMGSIAAFIMHQDTLCLETSSKIKEPVTQQELDMLMDYGLIDKNGKIERAEFVALCCVRLGTDPKVIGHITARFEELDEDGQGDLSMDEILQVSKQKEAEEKGETDKNTEEETPQAA